MTTGNICKMVKSYYNHIPFIQYVEVYFIMLFLVVKITMFLLLWENVEQ